MTGTRFYFAKFEIIGTLPMGEGYDLTKSPEERKREVFLEYLNDSGPVVRTEIGGWYFGRIEEYDGLIYGKFGKTFSDEPTVFDEDEGDFIESGQEVPDADYSIFVVDFEERILIFSSTYRVRNNNFITNFQKGFTNVMGEALKIELELIANEEDPREILKNYPIYKFEAEVRPTNPGPDPAFEDLDDSLQEMLVEKLGITAERFNGSGINMHEDFLEQFSEMSLSEYGESWRIEYGDDELLKVITSDEEPATERVEEEIKELGALRVYADQLISNAKSYFR